MTLSSLTLAGGQLLRAEAAPGVPDDRVREGVLVPWNEDGRTNLGAGFPVRPSLAASLAPDAKVVGIYGHNRESAVSRLIAHESRPEGLWGRLYVNRTPLGDQLLAEIDGGARDGLSIELADLVLDEAGGIAGGRLDFVAHVPVGAYSSARVHHRTLAATVTTPPNGAPVTLSAHTPAPPAVHQAAPVLQANLTPGLPAPAAPASSPAAPAAPAPAAQPAAPAAPAADLQTLLASMMAQPAAPAAPAPAAPAAQPAGDTLMAQFVAAMAQLQAGVHAGNGAPSAASLLGTPGVPPAPDAAPAGDPVRQVAQLQAAVASGDRTLLAALADITHSGMPMFQGPSGAIGEKLWEGAQYQRQFTGLMRQKELTSMKGTSWQWITRPKVEEWDGDKTEVPTGPVSIEEVPWTARRAAGGWDVDRAYRDFGTPEFWEEFYSAQTESYRELTDTWAAEAIVAAARDVSVNANVPAAYVGIDRTINLGPTQVLKAAALGSAILKDTPRVRTGPDYVLMNTADWLTLMDLTALDLPAFLGLLKVAPENFTATSAVPAGRVVLGVKMAMTFRELGGGAPIRVEALDVARGGIDSAVYGYAGYSHDRPGGVISVPLEQPV